MHIKVVFGELWFLHSVFWQVSREPLPAMKHLGNEISFQIYSSDLLIVFSLKGKGVRAKS